MKLMYKSGSEIVVLVLDRQNKKLKVSSSKTGYELRDTQWKTLFDPGKETIQEFLTDKMDDKQFEKEIDNGFLKIGYVKADKNDSG